MTDDEMWDAQAQRLDEADLKDIAAGVYCPLMYRRPLMTQKALSS